MDRPKRQKKDSGGRLSALEKLKQLKSGGTKNKCEIQPVENVYETVSEKEYTNQVLKRQEDDWIVGDDGGNGYVEDGREIFDDDLDEESIERDRKKCSSNKKTDRFGAQKLSKSGGDIRKMLASMPAKRKEVKLEDDDILNNLISELDSGSSTSDCPLIAPSHVSKKPKIQVETYDGLTVKKNSNCIPVVENASEFDEAFLDIMDVDESDFEIKPESGSVEEEMTLEKLNEGWHSLNSCLQDDANKSVNTVLGVVKLPLIEKENTNKKVFQFFYWDAYEDAFNKPGVVYLFGKVWIESAKAYVSCCICVKNIDRRMFFLPRSEKMDASLTNSTGQSVSILDVYKEFNENVAIKNKIMNFKTRPISKHYAFNLPDVPDTAEYLEVRYDAKMKALPSNLTGQTFCRVFGTNASFLETFLLDRKIKGPCWLELEDPVESKIPFSWCKLEAFCEDLRKITISKGGSPPPLVTMALSIKTAPISKSNENQILTIGSLVHSEYKVDKPAPAPPAQQSTCFLTRPKGVNWPYDWEEAVAKSKGKIPTKVEKRDTEREMLSLFLAKYQLVDPDLVVGHDVYGYDICTLAQRLAANKVQYGSRLGKLRFSSQQQSIKGHGDKNVLCGRLFCDVKVTAKELIQARSYDLDSLATQVLNVKCESEKINTEDYPTLYMDSTSLMNLIRHHMNDTSYLLRIMYELNAIPLALQITNIAGNVMSRTLSGGRAERNEFLLLHAFSEKGYIVPDKELTGTRRKEVEKEGVVGKKKPQFEGGLVLEPKRGFYDTLVLLMDFNSLYPSIIQEYNICYTTICVRALDGALEDNMEMLMKNLPDSNSEAGILPTEIKKLVESRREVKKLMQAPNVTPELKHRYDIRQKALKLTANSMYGCLGFSNSRFYAKPLAAIITAKGREILTNTKDMVQKLNYDVIYGDTDSLMINTYSADFEQVFKIGHKIKAEVNECYKQIELDIDGVYKYMLLLKKKKYAAISISRGRDGQIMLAEVIKGLDVVRRDWSQLSCQAGKYVLAQLLTDQCIDDKIENILASLGKLREDLEQERVPVSLLAITKQLTKNPEQYADKKSLPHVQVALRMNANPASSKKFKQGDTIEYVVCTDGTNAPATQRAYHVEEWKAAKAKGAMKIDVEYYLSQQIHAVVTRMCEPIEGIDAVRIAEALGLETTCYKQKCAVLDDGDDLALVGEERYKSCLPFEFQCVGCGTNVVMESVLKKTEKELAFTLGNCPNMSCSVPPIQYLPYIQNKLSLQIRLFVRKYYQNWMICEDNTCGNRTRKLYGLQKNFKLDCLSCGSNMQREYTDYQLFNQLSYFKYVFDASQVPNRLKLASAQNTPVLSAYAKLRQHVICVLNQSAYNSVDFQDIFKIILLNRKK